MRDKGVACLLPGVRYKYTKYQIYSNNNIRLFVGNFVGEWMQRPWNALLKRGVRRQTEGLDRPASQQRQRATHVQVGQQQHQ